MSTIVVGRHSRVWNQLSQRPEIAASGITALGHRELETLRCSADDVVWVLSYSRHQADNDALLDHLRQAGVRRLVYVSTATANVADVTRCYEYPRAKRHAEETATRLFPQATIVRIGVVVTHAHELPAGTTAATSLAQLADALLRNCLAEGACINLFEMVTRPFAHSAERIAHRVYGVLQRACGAYPCALRPLDVLLRAAGFRWYGYVYLSNRLWSTTT